MKSKTRAIIFLVLALMLLSFAGGMIWGLSHVKETPIIDEGVLDDHGILTGSALKTLLNQVRVSPGAALACIEDYPMYAYLFDDSFITFKTNEEGR